MPTLIAPAGEATYSSAIAEARNYSRWIISEFAEFVGRDILEVGIGHGSHLDDFPSYQSYAGVDIDAKSVVDARRRHPERKFFCEDITSAEFVAAVGGQQYDTIICLNTLEHVENDRGAVQNLLGVLRPGGHLLIFVPAFQALYSPLDRLAGHVRRYTRGELAKLLSDSDSRVVKNEYFNPIGGMAWWLNKFAGHRSLNDNSVNVQIKLFDRYVLPISRLINPVTKGFFGQSVVFVVQKL
jgi:SAM-dependent methyltransferase